MLRKLSDLLSKTRKDEKGFTLIELLVVILIIGILAAIALPSFLGQASKGAKATATSNIRAGVTKMEQCGTESASGDYTGCTPATGSGGYVVTASNVGTGYTLTVAAGSGNKLKSSVTVTNTAGTLGAITGGD